MNLTSEQLVFEAQKPANETGQIVVAGVRPRRRQASNQTERPSARRPARQFKINPKEKQQ
jgi:hypothetical protein